MCLDSLLFRYFQFGLTFESIKELWGASLFDWWQNDIHLTYCITSWCKQEDLTPWMHFLNENIHKIHPSWHLNYFIFDCAQREINYIKWSPLPLFIQLIVNYVFFMSLVPMDVTGINIDYIKIHQISCYMHFLFYKTIWLDTAIFLCLWQVKKTWQKQACIKIKHLTLCNNVLQELKNIMYD